MVAEKSELNIGEQNQDLNEKISDHTREYWNLQREGLSANVQESLNVDKREIPPQTTLKAYLESVLKNESIVLRALSSLQLQGYHEIFLPHGFNIEIKDGKLSIFKEDSAQARDFYISSATGRVVQDLPLLEAIPHQAILYFKSGESKETVSFKKVSKNKTEARQMVHQALEQGRFAKLTGMVNGVKISDKVRLGVRHEIAAKEILFLLENTPHIFDQATLDWIHKNNNLEDLKFLSQGQWSNMNRFGMEAFHRVRSAEGVIQLTLAWRRLRSVLPSSVIKEIREGGFEIKKLAPLTMNLAQTESTSGEEISEDRKVMVETVVLRSSKPSKRSQLNFPPRVTGKKTQNATSEVIKADDGIAMNTGKDSPSEEANEPSKITEQIALEAWEVQQSLLDYLINEYPGLRVEVSHGENFSKGLMFAYQPEYLTDRSGKALEIKKAAFIHLPTAQDAEPEFEMEGLKNPQNLADIVQNVIQNSKQQIEQPSKLQLEELLQNLVDGMSRKEKRAMAQTGNIESHIQELRRYYKPRSIKLDVLLGLTTEFETSLFTGGLLGPGPIKIMVSKPKDEIGLEISGGKIKKQIFYSLESNAKYELNQK